MGPKSFKKLEGRSGVYCIRNLANNKRYIGSAVNLGRRFSSHCCKLNAGQHHNLHLQRAWVKYGSEEFSFVVIRFCQKDELLFIEQKWIDYYDAYHSGYNRRPKAESNLGVKWSAETKEKMRQHLLGNQFAVGSIRSPEHRRAVGDACRGDKSPMHRPEVAARVSAAQKGKPKHTPESRSRLSKATTLQFQMKGNPFLGKKHTEKTKMRLRAVAIVRNADPEYRRRLSEAVTGFRHTEETKARMSAAHTGIRHSPEQTEAILKSLGRGQDGRFCKLEVCHE